MKSFIIIACLLSACAARPLVVIAPASATNCAKSFPDKSSQQYTTCLEEQVKQFKAQGQPPLAVRSPPALPLAIALFPRQTTATTVRPIGNPFGLHMSGFTSWRGTQVVCVKRETGFAMIGGPPGTLVQVVADLGNGAQPYGCAWATSDIYVVMSPGEAVTIYGLARNPARDYADGLSPESWYVVGTERLAKSSRPGLEPAGFHPYR